MLFGLLEMNDWNIKLLTMNCSSFDQTIRSISSNSNSLRFHHSSLNLEIVIYDSMIICQLIIASMINMKIWEVILIYIINMRIY
jgi:hypothetical protein